MAGEIAIFYGSTSGITESIAMKIHKYFGEEACDIYSMEEDFTDVSEMLEYDFLLFGCSTWGSGEVQNDWRDPLFDISIEKARFYWQKPLHYLVQETMLPMGNNCKCIRDFIR
ncbi:flavodoxin domain-containing protein, partial [Richelia intracellularis]|uniref:flavodoxin domain-containing protein n=1 Tax=Richelia intracellularis TaxID=1164990 RepID=UPI001E642553